MPLHIANAQRFMTVVANNAVNGINAGKQLSPTNVMEAAKRRELIAAFRVLAGFSGDAATNFADAVRDIHTIISRPRGYSTIVLERVNEKLLKTISALEEVSHILHEQLIPNLEKVANGNELFQGKIDAEHHEDDIIFSPWFWEEGLQHLQMVIHDLREFHYDHMLVELVRQTEEQLHPVVRAIPTKLTDIPVELCRYANDNSATLH